MPTLLEDFQKLRITTRDETEKEFSVIENMITGLRENFYTDFGINVRAERNRSGILITSQCLYNDVQCDYEWCELIKSLRVADDDIHHLRFTNKYIEQHLSAFYEEIKDIKKISESMAAQLNDLTKTDIEFSKIVFGHLSQLVQQESKKETKNVTFEDIPRKSKSAEYSVHKICSSCGLVSREKQNTILQRKDKIKRKKGYGKYCSSCGAIEVSSQNSMIRCCDCNGEIILQGLCSSCDSFNRKTRVLPKKKHDGKIIDKVCSTCEMLRRTRICWDEKDLCNKCKRGGRGRVMRERFYSYHDKHNRPVSKFSSYADESSCCSDCEYTSSCDTPVPETKHDCSNRDPSVDSLLPASDSDQVTVNLRDNDVSCSISSSGTEVLKEENVPEEMVSLPELSNSPNDEISHAAEDSLSVDEEFNTPRESLSIEDALDTLAEPGSDPSVGSTVVEQANDTFSNDYIEDEKVICNSEYNDKSSDSGDYVEAIELVLSTDDEKEADSKVETEETISEEQPFRKETLLDDQTMEDINDACNRMHRVEEALNSITTGNTKLEEGISVMENISQQNLKLSKILREIMFGMTNHLELIQQQLMNPSKEDNILEEESDGSDEFEEATEDLSVSAVTESDADTFYDIPSPNHCYLCLECGIKTSNEPLADCCTCGRKLAEIPNGFLDALRPCLDNGDSSSLGKTMNELAAVNNSATNWKVDGLVRAMFPMFLKSDFSRLSLAALENRLKLLEKETNLMKDNNEIICLLIDDLQGKLSDELRIVQSVTSREGDSDSSSETTIVGFDFSIYQVKRTIAEKKNATEPLIEEAREEVCEKRTFVEMKFEEVFKKEQQTAVELEIFQQRLEIEGLIIKETEDYFTCCNSNSSQALDKIEEPKVSPVSLSRRYMSEKLETVKGEIPTKKRDSENDELLISIEIEVEKETKGSAKKAIRCEYKANLQKSTFKDQSYTRRVEYESILPTITLYPMWSSENRKRSGLNFNAECITPDNKKVKFEEIESRSSDSNVGKPPQFFPDNPSDGEFNQVEPYFLDIENDEFVHIKPPKYFYGSSDEESDSGAGDMISERRRSKSHSVAAVTMPVAMYPVTEIRLTQTPFAVYNNVKRLCQKREFGRISQVELEQSPSSGVVLVQTQAVSSFEVINPPLATEFQQEDSFEEFFEAMSQSFTSDVSFQMSARSNLENHSVDSIESKEMKQPWRKSSCLIKFTPVNMGGKSVASIRLPDQTLPIVITENSRLGVKLIARKDLGRDSSCFELASNEELARALTLIREIENDVVEVKLHNAIAILPQLESVLREHIQEKMKVIQKKSSTTTNASLDVFMSTLNFLTDEVEVTPQPEPIVMREEESEARLGKMLQLLTGLEDAVRQVDTPEDDRSQCPEANAGRIYDLLKDLSCRIKGIGDEPNISEIEKTLELTSELDVAVRNYSSELHKNKPDSESSQGVVEVKSQPSDRCEDEGVILADKLKSMKKKIFEIVAAEAQEREERIEKNFDRIAKLEKENAEVMKFLDTLLDKTLVRVGELDEIRVLIYGMKETMNELMRKIEIREAEAKRKSMEREPPQPRVVKVGRTPTLPSIQEVSSENRTSESSEEERVKDTLSDMIVAVDNLKSKAKEKKQKYKEIFGEETMKPKPPRERQSSSAGTTLENVRSSITEFNKIGASTYYMAWTKPANANKECIAGYEIWVNGKVNQRVRNPERLKAVLYSVDCLSPGERLKIKLFALTDDGRRRSLADLRYPPEL